MKPNADTTTRLGRVPRLFQDAALVGSAITLDSKQAHYLRQVLRLKRGQAVVVFDGRGRECVASVVRLTREGATLQITSEVARVPESALRVCLLQAVTKSESMDLIVQKATELGVHSIAPVFTEFSVVKLDEQRARSRVEHWQRISRSACEQSGRHEPTLIEPPVDLDRRIDALQAAGSRIALVPGASTAFRDAAKLLDPGIPTYVLVGPEGGLSERDLVLADRANFVRATLGPRILRAETAAICVAALAQASAGDLG